MSKDKEQATREALHWLIALQEEPDDREVSDRFEQWLMASEANQAAWSEGQHLWQTLGAVHEIRSGTSLQISAGNRTPQVQGQAASHAGARRRWNLSAKRTIATAGVAATALCFALFLAPVINIWFNADFKTSVAELRDVTLEDGSVVHMGADSAISVSFEQNMRSVNLLSGEAYFEVEPDESRPFHVMAGDVETIVLGTAFDVVRAGGNVTVAVNHGRVAVKTLQAHNDLDAPLQGGDWVRVSASGTIERGIDDPEQAGGWRSGMLVVKDQAVGDVLDVIRRHYKGRIVSIDANLSGLRVTGVYDLKQPIEALRAVLQVHGASVREVTSWLAVVTR